MIGRREVFDQAMRQGHSAAWDHQWDRAITAYRTALKELPDEPAALTSLGFALLQADKLEDALRHYQRAATLNPGDPVAPEKCGEIFERQGRQSDAALTYLAVAEIHLKRRDVQKAIANWTRVVRLTPDNLAAHSRLALACERTGHTRQAVLEYVEMARIFQRARDNEKALAAATRAQQLDPQSTEARDAMDRLRRGVPLPLPDRPKVATGPLKPLGAASFAALDKLEEDPLAAPEASNNRRDMADSPLASAQQEALSRLAELMFEEDAELAKKVGGMDVLTRGTGRLSGERARRALATRHLGQAISSQTAGDAGAAINHYEAAVNAGLDTPLVSFVLGALHLEQNRAAEAIRRFRPALSDEVVGTGALFGLAKAEQREGKVREAVSHLLTALRRLDQALLPAEQQDAVAEVYESLLEGLAQTPPEDLTPILTSLFQFLSGQGWHDRVVQARRQLDNSALDGQVAPLADLLAVPGASQVVESLRRIESYMALRLWDTAMEEAYYAVSQSPTHLPVHIRMAEILTAEDRVQDAIDKYAAVAETYRIRGELTRATRVTQQVLRLSPLDATMRGWLIEVLVEQGKLEEALQQFVDLGETYYQLADLEAARSTYADALLLAQQHNLAKTWSVTLLHKMGDIDLQRLNWREAQHVYEQIKSVAPEDGTARATLIDLLFRLGSGKQALAELDLYLRQLLAARDVSTAVDLLVELGETHPAESGLVARLARIYQDTGRRAEAIAQYDRLGEMQLQQGQTAQAAETIRTILALAPDDASQYQQLLEELQQ
jgi:tetratricopeptide (TPR) repeat protein